MHLGLPSLTRATQVCVGCGRTIADIAAWSNLSDVERQAILRRLEASRAPATK